MTPIGNPQNLLIALQSGIPLPFITFIKVLGIPTIINLFVTYFILKVYFKKDLVLASILLLSKHHNWNQTQQQQPEHHSAKKDNQNIQHNYLYKRDPIIFPNPQIGSSAADDNVIVNPLLAKISIAVLLLTVAGFVLSEIVQYVFHFANNFSLSVISMLGATTLYALSK